MMHYSKHKRPLALPYYIIISFWRIFSLWQSLVTVM